MKYDDLNKPELLRRIERLEAALGTQAPIGYSSVSQGALRILSEEGLVVGEAEGENAGKGSQKVYGTVEITGTLRGDGTIDWEGPVQLKGKVDVTGRMHVMGGGRIVSSDIGDVNYSMQMFYNDARGNVVAFGVPMLIQAWQSVVQLNEDNLRISTAGNASVQLNRDGLRIEAGGASITMSGDGIQILSPAGSNGSWIEMTDGRIYFNNLPASDGTPIGVDAAGGLIHLQTPPDGGDNGGGGPSDPGGPGPDSVKTFYALSHWGDEFGATAGRKNPHRGQDINGWAEGTEVPSLTGGVVVLSQFQSGLGNCVTIDRGDGLYFGYAHLKSPGIEVGSAVTAGGRVGQLGNTGTLTTGPHVHVTTSRASIRPWEGAVEDPRPYIRAAIAA